MNNEWVEILKTIVTILLTTVCIGAVIRILFEEMDKFRKKGLEPYEKSLNEILHVCGEGLGTMFSMVNKMANEEQKVNNVYEFKRNEMDDVDID